MKVLYIGKFQYFWSTENYVTYALEKNGVKVEKCNYNSSGCLNFFVEKIKDIKPDFVLFSKPSNDCFPLLIDWCRSHHLLTVCWLWDLYWGYRSLQQFPPQLLCDLLFTTDGGHDEEWSTYGANHHVLRQGIHAPDHVLYQIVPKISLAFIGSMASYKQREALTRWLKANYKGRISWYNDLRGPALNKALSNIKVVVGESYPSPNYWSNRIYEILGRGGFMLFPETEGLDAEFTAGVHYVSYPREDYNELARLMAYYLEHAEEREKIRLAGFEHCGQYTYTSRTAELLEIVRQHLPKANIFTRVLRLVSSRTY